jgi:hypothetical protein
VPTGMSICTLPGDMTDFLRLATDAMMDEEGEGEGKWGEGHPEREGGMRKREKR